MTQAEGEAKGVQLALEEGAVSLRSGEAARLLLGVVWSRGERQGPFAWAAQLRT